MKEKFTYESVFRDCVSLKAIDLSLPELKPLGHSCFSSSRVLPFFVLKLSRLKKGKPRKTTYKTAKRFSAKRNK